VGRMFGPVMLFWFAVLFVMGLRWIVRDPGVLLAIDPSRALRLLREHQISSLAVLAGVFLCSTGGEALYADMGHFGKAPIRLSWMFVVMPALVVNYFGQGAMLIENPAAISNPFFRMAPEWSLWPLVILATAATVIASQAVISGAFSVAHQAGRLGYLPRLRIQYTSEQMMGQIYVPWVNWLLLVTVVTLVLAFRTAGALAYAYGTAVTGTITIKAGTTIAGNLSIPASSTGFFLQ